jgi:hypothetical protein
MSDENLGENHRSHCRRVAHIGGFRDSLFNRERLHGLVPQNPKYHHHGQRHANKRMAPKSQQGACGVLHSCRFREVPKIRPGFRGRCKWSCLELRQLGRVPIATVPSGRCEPTLLFRGVGRAQSHEGTTLNRISPQTTGRNLRLTGRYSPRETLLTIVFAVTCFALLARRFLSRGALWDMQVHIAPGYVVHPVRD